MFHRNRIYLLFSLEFHSYYIFFLSIRIYSAVAPDRKINKNRLSIYIDLEYIKPKRAYGGIQGLKPFPRTGRSDPDLANWDNAINAISAFDDEYDGKGFVRKKTTIYSHSKRILIIEID